MGGGLSLFIHGGLQPPKGSDEVLYVYSINLLVIVYNQIWRRNVTNVNNMKFIS